MSADGASGHLIEAKEVPRPDAQRGYIEIFEQLCKGCDLCIPACPVRIIEPGQGANMMGWRPVIVEPDLMKYCIGCNLCAMVCPDQAIEVFRFDQPVPHEELP